MLLLVFSLISSFVIRTSSFTVLSTSNRVSHDLSSVLNTNNNRNVFAYRNKQFGLAERKYWHIVHAKNGNRKPADEEDVPDDWSEDDVLAEFESDVIADDDVDVDIDDGDLVTIDNSKSDSSSSNDEDEDELDLDEIDLDDDDDEDDETLVEETVGEYKDTDTWDDSFNDNVPMNEIDVIPWDPEEDGIDYELQDDASDPNYIAQRKVVEDAVEASNRRNNEENFDAFKFVQNNEFDSDQQTDFDNSALMKAIEERARNMVLVENDFEGVDIGKEYSTVSDLMDDDPYPRHEDDEVNILENQIGITDDDMVDLDRTYKIAQEAVNKEPWDKVMVATMNGLDGLSNETIAEIESCLDEIGGSAYNVTNWLLYDLDFNVSNLILAAVKHNPNAPILFQHWYPQLVTYDRYKFARERGFDFNWDDVDQADISELERYYLGFGYESIPSKAPAETGIISLEDLDEEEIKMAAFENWMTEVCF